MILNYVKRMIGAYSGAVEEFYEEKMTALKDRLEEDAMF